MTPFQRFPFRDPRGPGVQVTGAFRSLENQPSFSRPQRWFSLGGLSRQLSSPRQVAGRTARFFEIIALDHPLFEDLAGDVNRAGSGCRGRIARARSWPGPPARAHLLVDRLGPWHRSQTARVGSRRQ